jgi:hypothetical protein
MPEPKSEEMFVLGEYPWGESRVLFKIHSTVPSVLMSQGWDYEENMNITASDSQELNSEWKEALGI